LVGQQGREQFDRNHDSGWLGSAPPWKRYDDWPQGDSEASQGQLWNLRKRFQWCEVGVRANELPPDAPFHGDLELALTVLNQGRTLSSPGIGH
jgi:hypothetical protein